MGREGWRRRVIWAILGISVGLIVIVLVWSGRVREPVYEGRAVSEWSMDLISPRPELRSNATVVLRAAGSNAVPALIRQLRRRDSVLKRPFIAVAPRLPISWRRSFLRFVRPFNPADERKAAAAAMSLVGTNAPVGVLLRAMRDRDPQVGSFAAVALGAAGGASVPGLIEALEDRDARIRSLACYGLGLMGAEAGAAVPALSARILDGELQIAEQAAWALSRIGEAAVPVLVLRLGDPEPRARVLAARTLGRMGRSARGSVSALLVAAGDSDATVRKEVREALQKVSPGIDVPDFEQE
jgi:HEAT repeat protein